MMFSYSYVVVALSCVQTLSLPITQFYTEQECYCHLLLGCSCFCLSHKNKGCENLGLVCLCGQNIAPERLLQKLFLNEEELLNKYCYFFVFTNGVMHRRDREGKPHGKHSRVVSLGTISSLD